MASLYNISDRSTRTSSQCGPEYSFLMAIILTIE